jgi:hypothetical protein
MTPSSVADGYRCFGRTAASGIRTEGEIGEAVLPVVIANKPRYQWPHGLRRGSAAVRLLGLRVRIPPGV